MSSSRVFIDSALSECDSEDSVVSPGLVPGVDDDPMVSSPTNDFDGVSSESLSSSVTVNSSFVRNEVLLIDIVKKGVLHRR